MTPDLINGLFEIGGAVLLGLNVRALMRDRQVQGVHWGPVVFWTGWGLWNLYYYPALGQSWSFIGGCAVVSMNAWWLALMVYYRRRNRTATP